MSDYERVASIDELQPGGRLSVFVDDEPVLLVQKEDGCYAAIEDVCTHDGQPLTDGPVNGNEITCNRHGARFDLTTGKPLCMPATDAVQVYDVKVEDGSILLRPAAGEAASCNHPSPLNTVMASAPSIPTGVPPGAEPATAVAESEDDSDKSIDEKMIDALRNVIDPELMINIVDLGLVYSINHDGQKAFVDMTLTSPACPAGPQIIQQSKMALERLRDVEEAEIKLVMTPPWTPERMTDEARDHLGIF
ncbi:MAG: Rieske 2Fe-2S domain-containing protein [Planctomycetota bacterium]|jgi:metal-sulfur cluster biosynthetic enzyme/nitrite reductase/ring-hydroxylating ferredoxin subunit